MGWVGAATVAELCFAGLQAALGAGTEHPDWMEGVGPRRHRGLSGPPPPGQCSARTRRTVEGDRARLVAFASRFLPRPQHPTPPGPLFTLLGHPAGGADPARPAAADPGPHRPVPTHPAARHAHPQAPAARLTGTAETCRAAALPRPGSRLMRAKQRRGGPAHSHTHHNTPQHILCLRAQFCLFFGSAALYVRKDHPAKCLHVNINDKG